MPSKGDGAGTDTFRPHRAHGQLRNTENRQRLRGLATASLMPPLRLIAVPPCSFSLLLDKDFFRQPVTHRLFAASNRRLCLFVRSSLHWHKLRLLGLHHYSLFIDFMSIGNNYVADRYVALSRHAWGAVPIKASHKRVGKYKSLARFNVWLRTVHSVSEKSPHSCGGSICSVLPEPSFLSPHDIEASSNSYSHTVIGRMVKKKHPPI